MYVIQQRHQQRNITPNFLRFRRKNIHIEQPLYSNNDRQQAIITDRSTSKASKCSLQAYQRRILHLSKLKNYLNQKTPINNNQIQGRPTTKRINYLLDTNRYRPKIKVISPRPTLGSIERQNKDEIDTIILHRLNNSKKRNSSNSASSKVHLKARHSPSQSKRAQDSLERQQGRAKLINKELLNNMMRNQMIPNYITKMKMKKTQTQIEAKGIIQVKAKSQSDVVQLKLNLKIPIKAEQQLNKYQIYGELGKGAYGVVRMGINKQTNDKIAIKIYQKKRIDQPNKLKNLQRQINILAELQHHVIAKLIEAIQTPYQIYLILEYGGANSLYNYLLSKDQHRLNEGQAKLFLLTIAEALGYLHRMDIVHRDIKAENILINRHKQLKLIDFGFSLRCSKLETIDTFCGTPTYMAPQIVSKVEHCPVYTDMWSLGILFYVMLQGNYPFRANNETELFEKIKKGHFEYIHNDISKQAKWMIESLLVVDPYDRLLISEVLSKENRAWLMAT